MGRVKEAQETMEAALKVDPANALLLNNAAAGYPIVGPVSEMR